MVMSWENIVSKKQNIRAALIEAACLSLENSDPGCVVPPDQDIVTLTSRIAKSEITAQEVALVYIKRAIQAQEETNCLTEILFESALKQAKYLDEYQRTTGKLLGPLHGVPVSVKDQFNVQGVDTTLGYVGRSFKPSLEDAALVTTLKTLGAIIISKTAIPQSILWGETESPLWGVTTYPGRPNFTSGGSSGGEAALLAMSGSVVGWGTDIGGSIRGPAHMCGLFGLKPSGSRFSYAGAPVSHEGQGYVPSSVGPLCRDLASLITVTKACLSTEPWILDPNVTPIPWRQDVFESIQTRPLKVGVIYDDGVVRPFPEIQAAVRKAEELLCQAGHQVVNWETSEHLSYIEIMDQFYRADGGEDIRRDVEVAGEPLLPHVAALVESAKPISVFDYWQLSRQRVAAQQEHNRKWNDSVSLGSISNEGGESTQGRCVDVIISPVLAHTSVPHRKARWTGYTKVWNFLDYTAMSFPAGVFSFRPVEAGSSNQISAGEARREYLESYTPRNDMDAWNQKLYKPEELDGLPIGIQIIGRRFQEEKVLGAAAVLEKLMKNSQ